MKTYYFHYRLEDQRSLNSKDYVTAKAFFAALFVPRLAARGGLTVAYRLVGEDQPGSRVEVEAGVAFCSVKDNYYKATGRLVAGAMLEEKPLRLVVESVLFNFAGQLNFAHLRYRLIDALVDDPAFVSLVPRKFPINEVF